MTDTTPSGFSIESGAPPSLAQSWSERRALSNALLTIGAWIAALLASVPLVSVLYMLIVEGGSRLSLTLFTELPPAGFELGGGFGNAIVGTLVLVAIAALRLEHVVRNIGVGETERGRDLQ